MSEPINYCPHCASDVEVLGTEIEDRRACICHECGSVEITYHQYGVSTAELREEFDR